jgi:hypothetical protein
MAKVYGITHLELKPGVTPEQLEAFYARSLPAFRRIEGMEVYLLKADKGRSAGKYLQIIILESVAVRDEVWGAPGDPSGAGSGWTDEVRQWVKEWGNLVTALDPPGWTDYVTLEF